MKTEYIFINLCDQNIKLNHKILITNLKSDWHNVKANNVNNNNYDNTNNNRLIKKSSLIS